MHPTLVHIRALRQTASAARRGLPLLTAEVELELTAPAELEAAS